MLPLPHWKWLVRDHSQVLITSFPTLGYWMLEVEKKKKQHIGAFMFNLSEYIKLMKGYFKHTFSETGLSGF